MCVAESPRSGGRIGFDQHQPQRWRINGFCCKQGQQCVCVVHPSCMLNTSISNIVSLDYYLIVMSCVIAHWMDPHSPRHCHHTLVWKGKLSGLHYSYHDYKSGNMHPVKYKVSLTSRIFLSCFLILQDEIQTNLDLIATYRHHITTMMNQSNVIQFLRSYNNRTALEVERPVPGGNINVRTLKLVQWFFPHIIIINSSTCIVLFKLNCN